MINPGDHEVANSLSAVTSLLRVGWRDQRPDTVLDLRVILVAS